MRKQLVLAGWMAEIFGLDGSKSSWPVMRFMAMYWPQICGRKISDSWTLHSTSTTLPFERGIQYCKYILIFYSATYIHTQTGPTMVDGLELPSLNILLFYCL